jgi:hypothetical protein
MKIRLSIFVTVVVGLSLSIPSHLARAQESKSKDANKPESVDLSGKWSYQVSGGQTRGIQKGTFDVTRAPDKDNDGFTIFMGPWEDEMGKHEDKPWMVASKGKEIVVCLYGNCGGQCHGSITGEGEIVAKCSLLGRDLGEFGAKRVPKGETKPDAKQTPQEKVGPQTIAAKMAAAVSRASAGVSGGMNPLVALAMPGVNDPGPSAVRQALREAAAVTGESFTGREAFDLELVLIQWLTGRQNISDYPPRAKRVTKALLTDWQTTQTALNARQTQLTLVLLGIVFQDDLWEGSEWKVGNPARALARLKGLPLDAVTKWATSANIPQFGFAAANSLIGVDELFIDGIFQTSLFDSALPIATAAIGKSASSPGPANTNSSSVGPPPTGAPAGRLSVMAALNQALAISDPEARLSALVRIRTDYGDVPRIDYALLGTLVTWPDRIAAINEVVDRMLARIPPNAGPFQRFNFELNLVDMLVSHRVLLDRSAQIIADRMAGLDFDTYATTEGKAIVPTPTQEKLRANFNLYRARGFQTLGRISLARGDIAQGEEQLREALKLSPDHLTTARFLVQHYVTKGDRGSAERVLKDVIANTRPGAEIPPSMELASLYVQTGESRKAEALLIDLIKTFKLTAGVRPIGPRRMLAEMYLAKGDLNKATEQVEAILKEAPNDVGARAMQARIEQQRTKKR